MRKYAALFILLLLISANGWSQSTIIAMRIPDSTVVKGNIIDLPVYADSSLTNENIVSYALQLNYDQSYFQPESVIVTGTISASFGDPTINTSIPGKITIAGAGTTPLAGIGKFIYVRLKALQTGNINLSFSGSDNNYFNEGSPEMTFKNGYINIIAPPSIVVSPENGIICKGEQLQFNVSGGTAPYQWSVTNSSIATINTTGLLVGTQPGFTKVVAQDNNGLRDTTNQVEIRAMRLSIPSDLGQWQGADVNIPFNITDITGLNISSGNFTISFNQDILTPVGVVQTGTLLASYSVPVLNISEPGNFSLAFAGTVPLTGSGTLIYVRFHVSAQNTGTTQINFNNCLFNETLLPAYTNGNFTTNNLAVLSISPGTGYLAAGETQQFTVNGNGIPPFTWSVNDTVVTSINQSGLMTAIRSGVAIVTVKDSVGATTSSGNFQIYDTRINMPDTVTCPETLIFYYPILITSLPSGESVFSMQATISYDTTYLAFLDIETEGTLTQGWTFAKNPSFGQVILAGSGTSSFNSAGTILKLEFNIKPAFTLGASAYINLNNVTLNEGVPLPLVDINGSFKGAVPESAGTLTGINIICQKQQGVAYSVPAIAGATSYVWTLPAGATIATGDNTNSISVNYSDMAISGNIAVYGTNGCGSGAVSPYFAVTVSPSPDDAGSITGQDAVCQGQTNLTYTVPEITNATSYLWTLPTDASGTSTTNSITVDYGTSAVSGDITVKGQNSCGDGTTSSFAIIVNPLPVNAGIISGNTTVCQGQTNLTYTVPKITNATSYLWTLPTGATGTSTTNSITIDYGTSAVSGDITVKGQNSCGDGTTSSFAVTVNPLPANAGIISGNTTVCQGENSVTYNIAEINDAISYFWTLPSGVTGTSTTNNITVDYGISALSGDITVKGQNSCGDGAISSLSIVVNTKPATPVITRNANGNILHSDAVNGNQWYKQDTLINGATNQDYTVSSTGDYYVIVTDNGCSSAQSNLMNVVIIGIESLTYNKSIKVYPNPVSNELIIEIEDGTYKRDFEILNSLGQLVYKGSVIERTVVQTTNFSRGIYLIKFENVNTFEFKEIVKE